MTDEIAKRFQSLLMVWFALMTSVGLYFLVAHFQAPAVDDIASTTNRTLNMILGALALLLVAASFLVRRVLLSKSVQQQSFPLVLQAHIVAWAMCEVCGVLGLVSRFIAGYRQYYVLMLLAVLGIALQFPARAHLLAASPNIPLNSSES
jgi:hypothetical protein